MGGTTAGCPTPAELVATSAVVATMRCAELVVVREAGLGYEICFGAGVAGAR